MFNNFSGFPDYLRKCSHIFQNDKFIKVIQDFNFILISKNDEIANYFEKDQLIKVNIQNSKVIIIDIIDEFISLCFEKTLIILSQSLISSVYTFLSNYPNLSICFLKSTKEIFLSHKKEKLTNPIIEYDKIFEGENNSLNDQLDIGKKSDIFQFWPFFSPCISGYLIKKSYFKISDFNLKSKPFSFQKLDEYDYIELRNLVIGSSFVIKLIYHIASGELFSLKQQNGCKEIFKINDIKKANYEKIHHSFLPKFHGTVNDNKFDFFIIEFNGQTLNDCKFDKFNEDDIIQIINQLLDIVEYFHDNNFLIRDLKPNNLMITEQKEIAIIDLDKVIIKSNEKHTSNLNIECAVQESIAAELSSYESVIYSFGKVIEFILKKTQPRIEISAMDDKIKQKNLDQRLSIKEIIMFKNFCEFEKYLKENSFINSKLKKVIQDFNFILISKKDEIANYFEKDQLIKNNIQNSKVIIIDLIDEFIILCFEKTLIILSQSLISSVYTLLSFNSDLSVCFLKNTKDIFKEEIKNPLIEYDEKIFNEEIENFNNNLCINKKNDYFQFCSIISGYLIKKSYLKRNEDSSLGTVELNDFIELRYLGFGTLFVVQLIYHIERGELFALKKANSGDKEITKLIKREKMNYEKIHHPFIPKFYGTVKYDKLDYIIIEFINGQTLNDCKFDKFNEDDIIQIINQLLDIVEYFHDNNFLIRDLKPNNLMITEQKKIIMIDLDRVIIKLNEEYTGDLCKKCVENEVNENGLYSEKSDIFSLGKVIEFIYWKKLIKELKYQQSMIL